MNAMETDMPVDPAGAESAYIPQLDGADPDPNNVCDPHSGSSGYVFNVRTARMKQRSVNIAG